VAHTHRVLIVEDDYAFRWSLAMRCQRRRIDADVAETLREASDLINKSADYCAIMIDLKMGKGDGTMLLDPISRRTRKPKVVVITGYPDAWDRVRETDQAALIDETIFKPADVDNVIDAALKNCD
jgi:two-component system, OmpR family, response regulator